MQRFRQGMAKLLAGVSRAVTLLTATALPVLYPAVSAPSVPWSSAIDYVWEQLAHPPHGHASPGRTDRGVSRQPQLLTGEHLGHRRPQAGGTWREQVRSGRPLTAAAIHPAPAPAWIPAAIPAEAEMERADAEADRLTGWVPQDSFPWQLRCKTAPS